MIPGTWYTRYLVRVKHGRKMIVILAVSIEGGKAGTMIEYTDNKNITR